MEKEQQKELLHKTTERTEPNSKFNIQISKKKCEKYDEWSMKNGEWMAEVK